MRPARSLALMLTVALTAGCAQLPPIDRTIDAQAKAAPYPNLIATARFDDAIPEPLIEDTTAAELQARGDRLRAKGARLRRQ
ncbi:hypothetical protein ATO6_21640 [Oceanicola sp. 22II-s10i]|uniref:hypothetical protein n=1 Tax=Oceanicola sp. 22II-s10i TaxID=1317116 RepID=UPI000B527F75|nr:hypothetical protein [Oceanicola sp. 22II-s10i]OWU82904.1 hypothetical protein ATO6_21640 [Oceanicola sp. 22II-s10i]